VRSNSITLQTSIFGKQISLLRCIHFDLYRLVLTQKLSMPAADHLESYDPAKGENKVLHSQHADAKSGVNCVRKIENIVFIV
jgi:hypothetical protein